MIKEKAIIFDCCGSRLVGLVHGEGSAETGVLVVVGGPQYRVGSHRQFLMLARHLAANNVPVMRFDYRGMGDSEGETRSFGDIGEDICAAIDAFFEYSPGLSSVVLWGLCDAASAAVFYGHTDSRVKGMILLNPWVHTEEGEAKAYLKHYYIQRLFDKNLWKKILRGKFELKASLVFLFDMVKRSYSAGAESKKKDDIRLSLPDRMCDGVERFHGWVNVILSGDDLTAAEFGDLINNSLLWKKMMNNKKIELYYLKDANHTFSRQVWRDEVAEKTLFWVKN